MAQLVIFLFFCVCLNVAKYHVVSEKYFRFNCILNHLWWYTNSSCRNWLATLGPMQKVFTMGWNWASVYYVRIQLAEEKATGVIPVNLSHSCSVGLVVICPLVILVKIKLVIKFFKKKNKILQFWLNCAYSKWYQPFHENRIGSLVAFSAPGPAAVQKSKEK